MVIVPPAICFQHIKKEIPIDEIKVSANVILYKTNKVNDSPGMIAVRTAKGVVVFDAHADGDVKETIENRIEKDLGKIIVVTNICAWYHHTNSNSKTNDDSIGVHDNSINELNCFIDQLKTDEFNNKINTWTKSLKDTQTYSGNSKDLDNVIFLKVFVAKMGCYLSFEFL
jgi:hypothetical protein